MFFYAPFILFRFIDVFFLLQIVELFLNFGITEWQISLVVLDYKYSLQGVVANSEEYRLKLSEVCVYLPFGL